MHFPKGERYVSILKAASDPEAQTLLLAERERLRKLVKHQLSEAALLADPDEGLINNSEMVCRLFAVLCHDCNSGLLV